MCTRARARVVVASVAALAAAYNAVRLFEFTFFISDDGFVKPKLTALRRNETYMIVYR